MSDKINSRSSIASLSEGAIMIALATVLSFIIIFKLPWGGSITLMSMLPIALYSIKRGIGKGLFTAFVFSLLQLGQGIIGGLLGWGLTPAMLISCILMDYILPFTAIGISGIFRNHGFIGRISGIATAIIIRFAMHFLSGVVIWHSAGKLWEGFATENEWLYSLIYNGSYMLPELIFTLIGAFILFKVPQTKKILTEI